MSAPLDYTPATRADLLPGSVFVVMGNGDLNLDGIGHCFRKGERVVWISGDGTDVAARFQGKDEIEQYISLQHLTPAPAEPVTSHAAAAEIARLRAEVAALREALRRFAETRWDADATGAVLCMIQTDARAALAQEQAP